MRAIDTHCHAQFNSYKNDMHDVVLRSLESGVGMIIVGTQADTSKKAVDIAKQYNNVWAAVGLHPSHLVAQTFVDPDEADELQSVSTREEKFDANFYKELATDSKVIAIGEFGLDYYRLPEEMDCDEIKNLQKQSAREQLDLADELDLPVIIHCRDAHDDLYAMLDEYIKTGKLKKRGVLHCYTEDAKTADRFIQLGFYVSFTGILAFPDKKNPQIDTPLQNTAREIHLDKILIETDAPYLSPPPYRGQRNEPKNVIRVAEELARIKNLDLDDVLKQTTENAVRLFGLKI